MATAPPIARDRLIGLAGVRPNLVRSMELRSQLPPRMDAGQLTAELEQIGKVIGQLIDSDIFPWLKADEPPTDDALYRAATVVSDRLCGAVSDPIIRNAQEQRQLTTLQQWLEARGYTPLEDRRQVQVCPRGSDEHGGSSAHSSQMPPATFSFRLNLPVQQSGRAKPVNLPIDAVIMPRQASLGDFPLLVEAKSAGDFTNTNKRRKEEATKVAQLKNTYRPDLRFVLFLCGYFDSGYLGYSAAEGIDWVWEHRIDDFAELGL
jgi:hypothetical protein